MKFTETTLTGAWIIDIDPISDDRGFFARWYCTDELAQHGLEPVGVQGNLSYNRLRGTVRGMHMQRPPAAEIKLIRCMRGAVYDVIIDARPDSPTRWQWVGVELTADNRRALYVPRGFLHGYQTLSDDAEVMYQVSDVYAPGHEAGVRYDDPHIGAEWPLAVTSISEKDQHWPLLADIDRDAFGRASS
ncbi:MAG: dTDP-4-dehydrorhamnose 3,5-epimerase [Actinomycetota bacterium]